jgi:hypothetical protein
LGEIQSFTCKADSLPERLIGSHANRSISSQWF